MTYMKNNFVFTVCVCPSPKLVFTNRIFVSKKDFDFFTLFTSSTSEIRAEDPYINVWFVPTFSNVYMMVPCDDIADGTIALNPSQISKCGVSLNEEVRVRKYGNSSVILLNLHLEVEPLNKKDDLSTLDLDELSDEFHQVYNNQVFKAKNTISMDYNGLELIISVVFIQIKNNFPSPFGTMTPTTNLTWEKNK